MAVRGGGRSTRASAGGDRPNAASFAELGRCSTWQVDVSTRRSVLAASELGGTSVPGLPAPSSRAPPLG